MASFEDGPEPVVGVFALRTFRVSANGFLLPLSFTGADWADGTCRGLRSIHDKSHAKPGSTVGDLGAV